MGNDDSFGEKLGVIEGKPGAIRIIFGFEC